MKMLKIILVSLFACMFMLNENVEGMSAKQAAARLRAIYNEATESNIGQNVLNVVSMPGFYLHVIGPNQKHLIYDGQNAVQSKTCIVLPMPQNQDEVLPPNEGALWNVIGDVQIAGAVVNQAQHSHNNFVDIVCAINYGYIGRVIPHGPANIPVQWVLIRYQLRNNIVVPLSVYPYRPPQQVHQQQVELNFRK